MLIPAEVEELKQAFGKRVGTFTDAGVPYILIEGFVLPDGCEPREVDVLLCPVHRDGYQSRLFFSCQIKFTKSLNWNAQGVRIADRNWWAYSWKTMDGLRLLQMIAAHIGALT